MVDTVRVKALRSFAEAIPGRGIVVFNGPREEDKKRGVAARKGSEDDLPVAVAEERVRRGYAEAIGEGAAMVNKSAAEKRRERTLAAREARRAQAIADGGVLMGDADGEAHAPLADNEAALRKVQGAVVKGDELDAPLPTADGPGTQDASMPPGEVKPDQEGEPSSATADATGDGASSVLPQGRIVKQEDRLAFQTFDHDSDGRPGGSKRGAESTRARGARKSPGSDAPAE